MNNSLGFARRRLRQSPLLTRATSYAHPPVRCSQSCRQAYSQKLYQGDERNRVPEDGGPQPSPNSFHDRRRNLRPVAALLLLVSSFAVYSVASDGITIPTFLSRDKLESLSPVEKDQVAKRENGVSPESPMRLQMQTLIKEQQRLIIETLERIDGKRFRIDEWQRPEGGGGVSCVLQEGNVFEKAGVNTSIVYGKLPKSAIAKMRVNHKALDADADSLPFFAAGLSLVLHPRNPMAPTVHLNYRYFETDNADGSPGAWWFGGGTDLTPSYVFEEDAVHFHRTMKTVCDAHDRSYYPRFKAWCDKYFLNKHRNEARGLGGIFFDDLDETEKEAGELFAFVQDALGAFLPSYVPVLLRRKDMAYSAAQKQWQQLRRGRYVEFNLVHDRGTSFGLSTPGARVESILMSLPLTARWEYMHEPEKGSREDRLVQALRQPRDWV